MRAEGLATVFYEGDRDNPDPSLGCVRAARRLGLRDLRDHLPIVAMREGGGPACGTIVYVERAGRTVLGIRLDSGPANALIDLSLSMATALDLPGRGTQRKGDVQVRWR